MFQGGPPRQVSAGREICTHSSDWCQSPHLGPQCGCSICLSAQARHERVDSGICVSASPLGKEGELVGSGSICA